MIERLRAKNGSALSYAALLLFCSLFFSCLAKVEFRDYDGSINYAFLIPLVSVVIFGGFFGRIFAENYVVGSGKLIRGIIILFEVISCSSILAGVIYPLGHYFFALIRGVEQSFGSVVAFWLFSSYMYIMLTLPVTLTLGIYITSKLNKAYGPSPI